MLENIFITGTANHLVLQLGSTKNFLADTTFYHTVTNLTNQPKNIRVSHLSAFSAPLICTYARSNLDTIDTIVVCFRIPTMPSFFDEDKDKLIEKSFQIEWYFSLDLIHQSISLFTHNRNTTPSKKGRLFICIPHVIKTALNGAQKVYYNSFLSAMKSFIAESNHNQEIAIIQLATHNDTIQTAYDILFLIDSLQHKRIHKKIFYQDSRWKRLRRTIFS